MRRFTPEEKLVIIKEVKDSRQSVYATCRKHKISKVTFYKWLSRYKANRKNREISLQNRIRKGNSHPRSLTFSQKLKILSLVHKDPKLSSKKLAEIAGLGNHGVQNLLYKEGLNRLESRLEFSQKPFWKREGSDRREAMIKLQDRGWKINDICKQFKISKPTFIKWRKRYEQGGMLDDRFVKGEKHHKFLGQERERQILDFVTKNPAMSVHTIAGHFSGFVGHHGVQNILARHHLGTYEQRLAFSRLSEQVWRPNINLSDLPYIPLRIWRMLFAPFATIPKLGWLFTRGQIFLLLIFFLSFYFYKLVAAIVTSPAGNPVGTFFASISLTFGLFFFIYSMKYYISTLMVLKLAQSGGAGSDNSKLKVESSKLWKLLSKLFNLTPKTRVNPLLINLEKVELKEGERPFVSIHVAIYNEKRVVERLIRACEAQEWSSGDGSSGMVHREEKTPINNSNVILGSETTPESLGIESSGRSSDSGQARMTGQNPMNDTRLPITDSPAAYEVIIADDSTDETTAMAKEILSSEGRILDRILFNEEMEIYVSSPPVGSGLPVIKLIHRFSRSGFKGGALQKALENTNLKAAYITIFDADFVPYPDTIEQFVKTFQVLNANDNANVGRINANPSTSLRTSEPIGINSQNSNSHVDSHSNIAAVQGYQWHVLNKGANWVTRGVRTEYAGSYVIERASEEIYGGLKQIAGSVFCIRTDVLRKFGWGTSITEDFELTLKLYEAGYKVAFTPYIQGPAEAVSTIKTLIRQRMRWAEGASFNIKVMLGRMLWGRWETAGQEVTKVTNESKESNDQETSDSSDSSVTSGTARRWVPSRLTRTEKLEFAYLAPYYLQAAFFIIGTFSWFLSEAVFGSRLPFWTVAFGWSLVFTNLLALPLMNIVGMFLEESDERDYIGILSFIALSYIVVPFQAYAAIKGFLETEEGPWFRTPKTGLITDTFGRSGFNKFFGDLFGPRPARAGNDTVPSVSIASVYRSDLYQNRSDLSGGVAFAQVFRPLTASGFRVRPRYIRYAGNLALGVIVGVTVLMNIFAPLIPEFSSVWAQERVFGTLEGKEEFEAQVPSQKLNEEIKNPKAVSFKIDDKRVLEYIFHPEPRVRTKFDSKEIELKVIGSESLGDAQPKKLIGEGDQYIYEEIFENVDLRLTPSVNKLTEEFILKEYKELEEIAYSLKTVGLEVAVRDNEVYFAPEEGGSPLFTFTKPYMYEQSNPEGKNLGIEYRLEKKAFGYKLQKVLTEEGKKWLADPARVYPIVIDPTQITSTIQTAIAADESDYGQQQRKIVWANGALNGDAWYSVYEDAGGIFYEKCVPSVDGCETGTDWTDRTDIGESGGTADTDNRNPSAWWESDRAKMWVVWADNSRDNLQFVDIDVDAADPGTAGTLCSGADQANHNPTTWQVTITLDSSDTIYVSYVDTSTSTTNNMYRIATGGCTFTAILTGSGVDASDRPILLATGTQTLHAIFQDATTIRHSVYVNDASPGWDSADTDITGGVADNTSTNYSAATDGTDIWLIIDQGTSGVDLWTCAACAASSSWTDAADPWSSQGTDITEVSLAYDSITDDMVALALRGSGATEEVIYKVTDTSSISWGSEFSLGVFGGGASGLEDLSATMSVNDIDKVGLVVEDATNSELEFSTLPENLWVLLLTAPFWPKVFGKMKKKRRRFLLS